MALKSHARGFTGARITALAVIALLALALGYVSTQGKEPLEVPAGAKAGALTLNPCSYDTEAGPLPADCGTLVVPENHRERGSRLIALPVTRIRATGKNPADPVFRLTGGPGQSNMSFKEASRLTERHDVVLVGYRGIDGSERLDCPEITSALQHSPDLAGSETSRRMSQAAADCSRRLSAAGVDLNGYSLPQRVDDLEAARTALGYQRINLISTSAGTRTAMIYSWRYPKSIHRSVMIAVNPPGRFMWDPKITDNQLAHYADLCRADAGCAARTGDLAATMKATAAKLPDRWGILPIKNGNVRAATFFGLVHSSKAAAPLNGPTVLDAWLTAAEGDPSGFWAMSVVADLSFPASFVWGEFALAGMIDAGPVDRYYAAGGDPGSILGNAAGELLWAGGTLPKAWPVSPDNRDFQQARPTDVETLLISGTVDFTTPAELATNELLPTLRNGHQVKLAELGHSTDFWAYQPEASTRLLTAFYDRGQVDTSRYVPHKVDFDPGAASMSNIAKVLVGILVGFASIAVALLGWMLLRVRRRGGFGPKSGIWMRILTPVFLGLGGWFLAVLAMMILWPAGFIGDLLLIAPPMGAAIGLGTYLAWVHRDRAPSTRRLGLAVALAGSLLGAWFGFSATEGLAATMTTLTGAAIAANLGLLILDLVWDRNAPEIPAIARERSDQVPTSARSALPIARAFSSAPSRDAERG
ncbi:alpha/beta fold hydrolase [Nonomuraea sp. SYSU D8015]|uniref:alpha/beta fold hydrolase n=1 Tax=Nonomuraea sp. SYSU D8015 TaxID=2593644 RepID=UPI0016614424|nr:alpha/beta fold hydrolase [Nonomuraea sp. SYSU D8015]